MRWNADVHDDGQDPYDPRRSIANVRRGVFVGRASQVGDLHALWESASNGSGRIVAIRGDAGVGKTRLVGHALAAHGALWARCREAGAPPLWPWVQLARAAARAGVVGFEPIAVSSATPFVDLSHAVPASGHDRFERFDQMAQTLSAATVDQPLALVIDDAQWADDDSVDLLSFVAATIVQSSLLVALTIRTGEPFASPALANLLAMSDVMTIDLPGLARDELTALLAELLDDRPSFDVVAAVDAYAGGNPLFVTETARLMRSNGRTGDANAWTGVLPEGVRSVLVRRLARLPQDTNEFVCAAAVLGTEFDIMVLAAIAESDRSTTLDRVDPAIEAGLLLQLGDGRYQFAHALVREAALSRLPVSGRRMYHGRAAVVLAAVLGERAAAEIADHHFHADSPSEARRWSITAGRQAAAASMHADAAAWFERALRSRMTAADDHLDLLIEFAAAAARAGRSHDAENAFTDAVRLAREVGRADAFARAALGIGTIGGSFEVRVLDAGHQAVLREALERMEPGDSALRSWLTARLSVASSLAGDSTIRQSLADDAVAMARRIEDDAALAHALAAFCDSRAGPQFHDDRLTASIDMLAAAVRSGDAELELLARRYVIVALMEAGDVTIASRHVAAFARLADRLRQPQFQWFARLMEGMLAHLHGDLESAAALASEAADLGRAAGSANAHMVVEGGLTFAVLRDRGELERAQDLYREVLFANHEASRGIDSTPMAMIDFAPDPAITRRLLEQVPPEGLVGDNDAIFLLVATLTLVTAAYVDDREMAEDYVARLRPHSHRFVLDGFAAVCYGPVSAFLGRAEALLGDDDAARRDFEAALAAVTNMSAPLLEADIRQRLDKLGTVARGARGSTFIRDGEVWQIAHAGESAKFSDAKGLRDLAVLLAQPGRDVHVFDLVGSGVQDGGNALGPALDAAARRAYEDRIRSLTDDIEEASAMNDLGRAEALEDERDVLLGQLAAALGLSGRGRTAGATSAERARKAVGMRIRGAIDRIDSEMPTLGRHLRHAVHTGLFCSYQPEHPVDWTT